MAPDVELFTSHVRTVENDASPFTALYNAATPVTCGVAIEVPLIVFVPPFSQSDLIDEPGAYRSTQAPKFENDDFASEMVDEATVVVFAALAGDVLHASWFSFPAATATKMPDEARLFTAELSDEENPPPRLMLATAGLMPFVASQFNAEMMPDVEPEPLQLSTRTARSFTDFATP